MPTSNKVSPKTPACACTTVRKVSRVLGRVYDAALAPAGINVTQFAVMRAIARHDGEPLSHAADSLRMDRTSLYRAIAPMERAGWLHSDAGTDARSRSVRITKKGTQVLTGAVANWEQLQEKLIDSFGKSEWKSLASELKRLSNCAAELA